MYPKIAKKCETCVIGHFCNKNAHETILKECSELSLSERFKFATNKGLTNFKDIFTEIFWDQQDYSSLLIPIEIIKNTFENPAILKSENESLVKDQMFIGIIMKFCKLAEDFGGLVSSKDPDLYKFAQNFNKFNTGQSKRLFEKLVLTEEKINEIFFYPPIAKQKSEETQKFLRSSNHHLIYWLDNIKEHYLHYIEVYNSYKHGYRIRFKDIPIEINEFRNGFRDINVKFSKGGKQVTYHGVAKDVYDMPQFKGEKRYNRVLIFYNSKMLKKYPFCPGIIAYDGFSEVNFYNFYDSCIALIKMMEIFLNNFMISVEVNTDKQLLIFSTEDTEILKFNIGDFKY